MKLEITTIVQLLEYIKRVVLYLVAALGEEGVLSESVEADRSSYS